MIFWYISIAAQNELSRLDACRSRCRDNAGGIAGAVRAEPEVRLASRLPDSAGYAVCRKTAFLTGRQVFNPILQNRFA
jgi:hypothetical protein